jgi:hypothetical protein
MSGVERATGFAAPSDELSSPAEMPERSLAGPPLENASSETVPDITIEQRAVVNDNEHDATTAGPARFGFTIPTVAVTENQATAAVAIRRSEGRGPALVTWWTSDGSAVAGDDYAELEPHTQTLDVDEHTIYIPIIGDTIAESREHFYVNLGHVSTKSATVEATGRIEVVIVDDD